jgi:Sulfotransferase family
METLLQSIESLPAREQIELRFALAKAYDDTGRPDDAFRQLLAGNALKRRQIAYDEAATLTEIDRIQAIFTPKLMQSLQGEGDPSSVPIFIVGMPRSGTTLIEQILASHPHVFGAGELPNLSLSVADLRPAMGCAFPDAMERMSGDDLRQLGSRYVSDIVRLAPNAAHITNKMPANFLFAGLIHLTLPNARIIHAVRDPLDTCVSCFSKLFASGQPQTYDLEELGRYYWRYQALMKHWHRVLPPGRILDVRYEDVVADLEGQARRIVSHCGLEWDPNCLAFHETTRPVRTASATQVRRPLYRSAVGRAQSYEPFLRPLTRQLSGPSAG